MSLTHLEGPTPRPVARQRILTTASALFYRIGIRQAGVDRIIAEAEVAKATFYHHFPTKDALVCAYLEAEHVRQAGLLPAVARSAPDARTAITAVFDALADVACGPGFRGCPFVNAAVEYPDPRSPVRAVVAAYRRWFRALVTDLVVGCGHPDPGAVTETLVILRDGIVVAAAIDAPPEGTAEAQRDALRRALAATLGALLPPPGAQPPD